MKIKKIRVLSGKNIALYALRISAETTHNRGNKQCVNVFCGTGEQDEVLLLPKNFVCAKDTPGLNMSCAGNMIC